MAGRVGEAEGDVGDARGTNNAGAAAGDDGDAARDSGDAGGAAGGAAGGDNVYRPSLDFFTASSHTSTPMETQFTGDDTFSLEELLEQVNRYDDTPIQTG